MNLIEELQSESEAVLLPYQQDWVDDDSEFKVAEKSRRIGFTWADAARKVLVAMKSKSDGGMNGLYISYDKEMTRDYIEACAEWAKAFNALTSEVEEFVFRDGEGKEGRDILAFRLRFDSGKEILALSSRPRALRGKQGDLTIDEAAFVDDVDELLKAAMAFLIWGGRVAVISTHNGDDNPFADLVRDVREKKRPGSLHSVFLDDALKDGLFKRICRTKGDTWSDEKEKDFREKLVDFYGDAADEELFGIPSKSSGVYFSRALVEKCMDPDIPVLKYTCKDDFVFLPEAVREAACRDWCDTHLAPLLDQLNPHWKTFFGQDFGRSGDLSVIIPAQEQPNLTLRSICQIELSNVPYDQQRQILFYLVDRLPRFSGGALDSRGNGEYLGEVAMQKYGPSRIARVMPSQKTYGEWMPKYKGRYEDGTIVMAKHVDIVADHRAVRMERGIAKVPDNAKQKSADGRQRHGDSAIAGMLLIYANESLSAAEYEYESVGDRKMKVAGGY